MAQSSLNLIMIFNADGGLLNGVRDSFWKTFAPASYPCALCALAFGFFTVKADWKRFLEGVCAQKVELHKDDYRERLPEFMGELPVILLERANGDLETIASAEEMERMTRLDQLIALCRSRLEERGVGVAA
jgi:hypothetical protein